MLPFGVMNSGNILGMFGQVIFASLALKPMLDSNNSTNVVVGCPDWFLTKDEWNFGKCDEFLDLDRVITHER
jgi:hypothetical protein